MVIYLGNNFKFEKIYLKKSLSPKFAANFKGSRTLRCDTFTKQESSSKDNQHFDKLQFLLSLETLKDADDQPLFNDSDKLKLMDLNLPDTNLERISIIIRKTHRFDGADLIQLSDLPDDEFKNIFEFIELEDNNKKFRFDSYDIIHLAKISKKELRNKAKEFAKLETSKGEPRFNGFEISYLIRYNLEDIKKYSILENQNGEPSLNIFEIEKLIKAKPTNKIEQQPEQSIMGISPITNDNEYTYILEKLKKHPSFNKYEWWKKDEFNTGIMVYAGDFDIHGDINHYLRTGTIDYNFSKIDKNVIENYIKCFDYACKKIDERYGKYHGILYRYGYFNEAPSQYSSCSTDIEVPVNHAKGSTEYQYNVIFSNHGHKIKKVQEEIKSSFAEIESEIILDPNTKYEQITDLTEEQKQIKQEFLNKIINTISKNNPTLDKNKIKIVFWKEITNKS